MAYLLDANVFIQAKNLYHGLDFCPAFWGWLIARNAAGLVFSIERVGDEVEAGGDELATWAADRGPGFFVKPDAGLVGAAMAGNGRHWPGPGLCRDGAGRVNIDNQTGPSAEESA
jgi:hypothetical protein